MSFVASCCRSQGGRLRCHEGMDLLRMTLAVAIALSAACQTDDTFDPLDEPGEPRVATVGGTIIDWETGMPVEGASVVIEHGWGDTAFPTAGNGLERLTTNADGVFGPVDVFFDGEGATGLALLRVTGPGLAPTASDLRMSCPQRDESPIRCEPIDHKIVVPSMALSNIWRNQLSSEGVANAATVGLVLFEYLEIDRSPAAGVKVELLEFDGNRTTVVRYLNESGVGLEFDARATTLSGLAVVVARDEILGISGARAEQFWELTGVLASPGWIFVEDLGVSH